MKKSKESKIELLCPAGDLERLKTAVRFGADAVYCGLANWSLRNVREITFTIKTLKEGIDFAHKRGVKVYLTFNVFPHERMIPKIEKDLEKIKQEKLDIDGIIVADLGMMSLVKKYLPKVNIHISTQANTVNSESIKIYKKLGAKRIVLARELTLKEIKDIVKKVRSPFFASSYTKVSDDKKASKGDFDNIKIEVFGHGAMCIAYSGRCLLSKYYTNREANLGDCAQSCRWKYRVKYEKQNIKNKKYGVPSGRHFMEEELRDGDLVEIQEDKNGTYFLNSKEIMTLDILDKFIESGLDAFKIEGRAKSIYYLATVTRAYRKAIDAYYLSKKQKNKKTYNQLIKELMEELDLLVNRGYSHGFLEKKDSYDQTYDIAANKPNVIFIGNVLGKNKGQSGGFDSHDLVRIEVKNKFSVGEKVDIITPPSAKLGTSGEIYKLKIKEILDENGESVDEARNPQDKVLVKFDKKVEIPEGSIVRKKKDA